MTEIATLQSSKTPLPEESAIDESPKSKKQKLQISPEDGPPIEPKIDKGEDVLTAADNGEEDDGEGNCSGEDSSDDDRGGESEDKMVAAGGDEDDPLEEVDLSDTLPSRTRRGAPLPPEAYLMNEQEGKSDGEDYPLEEVDLSNILPSRTRQGTMPPPGAYHMRIHEKKVDEIDDDDDDDDEEDSDDDDEEESDDEEEEEESGDEHDPLAVVDLSNILPSRMTQGTMLPSGTYHLRIEDEGGSGDEDGSLEEVNLSNILQPPRQGTLSPPEGYLTNKQKGKRDRRGCPLEELDLSNILPSRTRQGTMPPPGLYHLHIQEDEEEEQEEEGKEEEKEESYDEDDLTEVDLSNILPSRTRRGSHLPREWTGGGGRKRRRRRRRLPVGGGGSVKQNAIRTRQGRSPSPGAQPLCEGGGNNK